MKLVYRSPSKQFDDPDVEQVIEHIASSGESYWNIGSGDAVLIRGERPSEERLEIYYLGNGLFQLTHAVGRAIPFAALPASPPPDPEYVKIHVGGERAKFSTAQAVGRAEAADIVRWFAATGERSPSHKWEEADWPE